MSAIQSPSPVPSRPLHDWPDAALVEALRNRQSTHHATACTEFFARFRPLLERRARQMRIPSWEWPTCVADVLSDEVLRLLRGSGDVPRAIGAYLVRCVHHRYLRLTRDTIRREQRDAAAAHDSGGESVVTALCSEEARRASVGLDAGDEPSVSAALHRLAHELCDSLTTQELAIVEWLGDGASHREITTRLGASYDATTKRIWRLCHRLRTDAARRVTSYPDDDRHEVARFFRRAGFSA